MPNVITNTVEQLWKQGRKVRLNPSGWLSGNAVCCADKRGRGGLRLTKEDGWVWHCFNCQFKTGWAPGALINPKVKRLFTLLGANDQQITQLAMEALRLKENVPQLKTEQVTIGAFDSKELPKDSLSIVEALAQRQDTNLLDVCEYVLARKLNIEQYFWSPELPRRFIIPFEWRGNLVGWTARSIDNIKATRYLSNTSPGYVYGLDGQDADNTILLVCEGVLDADAIGACAIMGSTVSDSQRVLIEREQKKIIWIPDRDPAGVKAAEAALAMGWSVSVPDWGNCKDINDAVILWGRTATLLSILQNVASSNLEAQLKLKKLSRRFAVERNH